MSFTRNYFVFLPLTLALLLQCGGGSSTARRSMGLPSGYYHPSRSTIPRGAVYSNPGRGDISIGYVAPELRNEKFDREQYGHVYENPFRPAARNPLSTFSIDVDTASYSNTRRYLSQMNRLPPEEAVRIEEFINYFSYNYPEPKGAHPIAVHTEVSSAPWNPAHRLVQIGIKARDLRGRSDPPRNLVFLVDVSGSMSYGNKLPLVVEGLRMLTSELNARDRVSIVVYAGASGLVLPPTPGDHRHKILSALESLTAGGSTAGGAGIELAYATARKHFDPRGINRVILCTDGDFNVGVTSTGGLVRLIERKRKTGIYLTVLGFGTGNLNDHMMENLADKGNGNYAYIDTRNEARKVLVKEIGATLIPMAQDVKLQVEFNPRLVRSYRLIGYENRVLKNQDFNDDKKDAGEMGAGHTVTALYEVVPAGAPDPEPASIDALKYQTGGLSAASASADLLTLKVRYKQPGKVRSRLLTHVVEDRPSRLDRTSGNFRFAAAVATFGMLLRDSNYRGRADFILVDRLARKSIGKDPHGYRREFLKLVRRAARLKGS